MTDKKPTAETKEPATKKTRKKPATKTIMMQMEADLIAKCEEDPDEYEVTGTGWKDMTGADFGDDPDAVVNQSVQTFTDTAAAMRRLRIALETGALKGGTIGANTFRVAACGEKMTPTVEPKQTNEVTF